jgi:hypothetical protein
MQFEWTEIRSLHAVSISSHKSTWLSTNTKRNFDGRVSVLDYILFLEEGADFSIFLPFFSLSSLFIYFSSLLLCFAFSFFLTLYPPDLHHHHLLILRLHHILLLLLPLVLHLFLFPPLFFFLFIFPCYGLSTFLAVSTTTFRKFSPTPSIPI